MGHSPTAPAVTVVRHCSDALSRAAFDPLRASMVTIKFEAVSKPSRQLLRVIETTRFQKAARFPIEMWVSLRRLGAFVGKPRRPTGALQGRLGLGGLLLHDADTQPSAICRLSTTKGAISYPPLAKASNRPRNRGNSIQLPF